MSETEIFNLILKRRRQILFHSVVYYVYDDNLIPDAVYDTWAKELQDLQESHPDISELVPYHLEYFRNFTGTTSGFNLPLNDPRVNKSVKSLLRSR